MIFVGSLSALIGNMIAKPVLTVVGEMNMIYLGIIVECSRLIIWSFVKYVLLQNTDIQRARYICSLLADLARHSTQYFSTP